MHSPVPVVDHIVFDLDCKLSLEYDVEVSGLIIAAEHLVALLKLLVFKILCQFSKVFILQRTSYTAEFFLFFQVRNQIVHLRLGALTGMFPENLLNFDALHVSIKC